jgi:hypothetical protein
MMCNQRVTVSLAELAIIPAGPRLGAALRYCLTMIGLHLMTTLCAMRIAQYTFDDQGAQRARETHNQGKSAG